MCYLLANNITICVNFLLFVHLEICLFLFTPQPSRAVGLMFLPMLSGWAVGRVAGKVCPVGISETVRCRKLILGRDIA